MSLNMYNVLMYNPVTVYMHCKTNMAGQADTEDKKTACKEIVQDVQLQTARVKHLKNKRERLHLATCSPNQYTRP